MLYLWNRPLCPEVSCHISGDRLDQETDFRIHTFKKTKQKTKLVVRTILLSKFQKTTIKEDKSAFSFHSLHIQMEQTAGKFQHGLMESFHSHFKAIILANSWKHLLVVKDLHAFLFLYLGKAALTRVMFLFFFNVFFILYLILYFTLCSILNFI